MTFMRRGRLADGGHPDRAGSERGVATLSLIIGGAVLVGAAVTVAYVATDGFGQNAGPGSASVQTQDAPTPSAGDRDPAASPMDAAFAAGQSVVCTYTHEAYDATTTLRSKDTFRLDQQTQGGPAHVIRGPEHAVVWIDGMTTAMEFDTDAYEQSTPGRYPTFDPSEFDVDTLFADGTCQPVPAVDEAVFELPADMTSTPTVP